MPNKEEYHNNKEYYKNSSNEYYKNNKEKFRKRYELNIEANKLAGARKRSKTQNVPFNLTVQDVKDVWPVDNKCPALSIPFIIGNNKTKNYSSPSLDRIIPSKGYVKDNIQIVSALANNIMSNATPDEVIKVGQYFKKVTEDLNMTHNNRTFDRQSYNQNDGRAKKAMVDYLKSLSFEDIEAKEDFYFDVSAKKDKNYFFEVEIKNQWGSSWNPSWKEVRIPERKSRLMKRKEKDYPDHDLYFVIFNTDCTQAWFIKDTDVDDSSVGTIQNSRQPKDSPHLREPFFHIPVEKAKLIQISY
jgi:hypothetical protein